MNITHHKNGEIKTLVEEAPYHPGYEDAGFKPKAVNNEPVAWMWSEDGCNMGVCLDQDKQIGKQEFQDYSIPLYTHPVELTDEEILAISNENYIENKGGDIDFARAILRKAQEK